MGRDLMVQLKHRMVFDERSIGKLKNLPNFGGVQRILNGSTRFS
jgi:hypothetical protein